MQESQLERRLKKQVESLGGWAVKFTSPGLAGVPDRIVLFPGGRMTFVEMKAPGQALRPLQQKRKVQLETLGFSVIKIDSKETMDQWLKEVKHEVYPTRLSGDCD